MTTKPTHTPGPWEAVGTHTTGYAVRTAGKRVLASVQAYYADDGELLETGEANAKLIAAAPELLEALTQLIDRLNFHGSIDSVREEGPIEDARAAIAKAEGC